jgi:hypothetical protein
MGTLKSLREKLPSVINKILFETLEEVSKVITEEFEITEDQIQIKFDELRTEAKVIFPYGDTHIELTIKPEEFYLEEENV